MFLSNHAWLCLSESMGEGEEGEGALGAVYICFPIATHVHMLHVVM